MMPLPWMAPISGDEPRETWRWTGGEGQGPPTTEVAADDREQINLVQMPGSSERVTVYEVVELAAALAQRDHARLRTQALILLVVVVLFAGLAAWFSVSSGSTGWHAVASTVITMAPLAFAGVPLAIQYRRASIRWDRHARLQALALRFDRWFSFRLPSRRRFAFMLVPVLAVSGWVWWSGASIDRVTWDPQLLGSEPWRWLTGSVTHASWGHLILNLLMALILGRTAEGLLGRPVAAVGLVLGMAAGGIASLLIGSGASSVGMSGGCMALLGMLLAWWWRWRRSPPGPLTLLVVPTLLFSAVIGVIGYDYINNAAHFGGLMAGVVLGACLGRPWPSEGGRPGVWVAVDWSAQVVLWVSCITCVAILVVRG